MRPYPAQDDLRNKRLGCIEPDRQFVLCKSSGGIQLPDVHNLFIRKFSHGALFADKLTLRSGLAAVAISCGVAPLCLAVAHIIVGRSREEMCPIAARAVIAGMAYEKWRRIFAGSKEICHSMGAKGATSRSKFPIPFRIESGDPRPALIGAALVNLIPKAFNIIFSKSGKWLASIGGVGYVRPSLSVNDIAYGGYENAKPIGQDFKWQLLVCAESANLKDLIIGQLCHAVPFSVRSEFRKLSHIMRSPRWHTAFGLHVCGIVSSRALEEVLRIATGWIVALVADVQRKWVSACMEKESDAAALQQPSTDPNHRVSVGEAISGQPTGVGLAFYNRRIKSLDVTRREGRKWFRLFLSHWDLHPDHLVKVAVALLAPQLPDYYYRIPSV